MPRTVKAYQQRWQDAMKSGCQVAPWDETLTPTSCVIYESARSTPMGAGCSYFPDFGDAICFYRYLRIPEELETAPSPGSDVADLLPGLALLGWSWSHYRSRYSAEELRRRRYEGERALDKLLARYVRDGYQADMGAQLIEIVAATLIDFALYEIYVLPDDLASLLARFGNPLANIPFDDDSFTTTPAFDLSAPGHREALAEHLVEMGR